MWFKSEEMELLETLGGSDNAYLYFERFVFGGDRKHALRSMDLMRLDGMIKIMLDGQAVEAWRLADWRRAPDCADTEQALQRVELVLTRAGARFYWG